MKLVLDMGHTMAMVTIAIIISTAPLIGVFLGSRLADKIEGGIKNLKQTYFLAFQLTVVGYFFNDILTFVYISPLAVAIIWFGIVFGIILNILSFGHNTYFDHCQLGLPGKVLNLITGIYSRLVKATLFWLIIFSVTFWAL
jgi:hypothetical protein